jgi:hypothetical protein
MSVGLGLLGFLGFFGLLLAPVLGGGVAEVVRWGVSRRRSRRLPLAAAIGGGLGAVPYVVFPLVGMAFSLIGGMSLQFLGGAALALLWPVLHAGLALSGLYYRLKGIRLG